MPLTTAQRWKAEQIGKAFGLRVMSTAQQQEVLEKFQALQERLADRAERDEIFTHVKSAQHRPGRTSRYGELWSATTVLERTGWKDRHSLTNRLARNTILRITSSDGEFVYPAFQFHGGDVLRPLRPVLQLMLPAAASSMAVLRWLTAPTPTLNGRSAIDVLRLGPAKDHEFVRQLAEQEAARWTR